MPTRALFTFRDANSSFKVYKHHDGYPEGAVLAINKALPHAWPLPRFEADEFAAAFVAGNKGSSGGVYLMPSGSWRKVVSCRRRSLACDIEFRYEVTLKGGWLHTRCWGIYCDDVGGITRFTQSPILRDGNVRFDR